MTNVMQLTPPVFAPGPVQGPILTKAFSTFYREVLSRMDLRYQNNDFGGLGTAGQVLTSTGVANPAWAGVGFPVIPNDTVIGNVSGSSATSSPLTQAQLTTLVNLATDSLSGAVPALPNDATKFFDGVGAYAVPAYPSGANPSAKVGTTAVNGSAATFMRSDAAPPLDLTQSYNFTGGLESGGVAVSTAIGANPTAAVGTAAVNGSSVNFMRADAAPAIDLTANYAWTGTHAMSANPLTAATTRATTGLVALKTSLSTSNSNALASDAALTITFNETGWYQFEIYLAFFEATSGAGGFAFNVFNGGSAGAANVRYDVQGFSTSALALVAGNTSPSQTFSQATISTSSTAFSWYRARGVLQVTGTGTAAVQWAQASTLAIDPTTLMAGSYFMATKVG